MFRLISGLIEPDESLVDPDDRHRSRLLTAMLTFVVPVGVVAVGVAQWVDGGRPDVRAVELVALLLMCALVPLSRGRHYRWGVLGFVGVALIMLCYVIVEAPADRAPVNASYMLVPVIAVSALWSTHAAVIVLGLNVFLLMIMGSFESRPFGVLTTHVVTSQVMVGGCIIIAGVFRDLLAGKKHSSGRA